LTNNILFIFILFMSISFICLNVNMKKVLKLINEIENHSKHFAQMIVLLNINIHKKISSSLHSPLSTDPLTTENNPKIN